VEEAPTTIIFYYKVGRSEGKEMHSHIKQPVSTADSHNLFRIVSCFAVILLASQLVFHPNHVFAQSQESVVSSSLLRFEDETPSHITVATGETVTFGGLVRSLISVDMTVSVLLGSNGTEGKDWILVEKEPSDSLALPAGESVTYEFKARFLRQGTFLMQPYAQILEIPNKPTPIDASSPDCPACQSRGVLVTVTGQDIVMQDEVLSTTVIIALSVAAVVIAGSVVSVFYLRRSRSNSKTQRT